MKITNKILSIPPYISSSWSNIRAIYTRGGSLAINVYEGESVSIPGLKPDVIEAIFMAHAAYLEENQQKKEASPLQNMEMEIPFRLGVSNLEEASAFLQHNPAQMDTPDLPPQILQKISAIAKIVAPDLQNMPQAEPHCNCLHCQIARAIVTELTQSTAEETPASEEEVPVEELRFNQWDVTQSGDKLFSVVNRLDSKERYSVYLGHPLGCTCGSANCEHIVAVLKS